MTEPIDVLTKISNSKRARVLHGILDGMYLTKSLMDYGDDVSTDSPSDSLLQEKSFIADPIDLIYILLGVGVLAGWSVLGNAYRDDTVKNSTKQFLAQNWAYARDFLSGLKNGRRAIVDNSFIIQQYANANVFAIVNPIAISVGVLLAANLMWYRHMNVERSAKLAYNQRLLSELLSTPAGPTTADTKTNSKWLNAALYASAFFDGITDGAYLYGCLFTLVGLGVMSFPPALLIVATVMIAAYMICSLIVKLTEESEKQWELQRSVDQYELELQKARVTKAAKDLDELKANSDAAASEIEAAEQAHLQALECQQALQQSFNQTYHPDAAPQTSQPRLLWYLGRAVLSGAKNGKAAVDLIGGIIHQAMVFLVSSVVVGTGYAIYLGADYLARAIKRQAAILKTHIGSMLVGLVAAIPMMAVLAKLAIKYAKKNEEYAPLPTEEPTPGNETPHSDTPGNNSPEGSNPKSDAPDSVILNIPLPPQKKTYRSPPNSPRRLSYLFADPLTQSFGGDLLPNVNSMRIDQGVR